MTDFAQAGFGLIDSHCHLDFPALATDTPGLIARAKAGGVTHMVTISTHVARWDSYRALAEAYPEVLTTIGTHPHHAAKEPDTAVSTLVEISKHPRCVAIGESGLDYFYDKSPRDVQEKVFRTHIQAARETGLPLVIHARDADADMIRILREEAGHGAFKAVLHCFSSTRALADCGLELGFLLSFSGMVTFKALDDVRAVARDAPLDRILVETDSPYLAPVPFRGKQNEPAYVAYTAAALAETKGVSPAEIAGHTTATFLGYFPKAAAAWGVASAAARGAFAA